MTSTIGVSKKAVNVFWFAEKNQVNLRVYVMNLFIPFVVSSICINNGLSA